MTTPPSLSPSLHLYFIYAWPTITSWTVVIGQTEGDTSQTDHSRYSALIVRDWPALRRAITELVLVDTFLKTWIPSTWKFSTVRPVTVFELKERDEANCFADFFTLLRSFPLASLTFLAGRFKLIEQLA
ncbi:hypothetical protein RRG08_012212 [Elysia crispata]|uniref:Uncharacterized protein n=1 Tax=Elysia crispata TaxID=231223 RepID=A0AAE0Z5W9_9GAST|nr:hypothetical protein RRG08_012212 [Elysia crispata]